MGFLGFGQPKAEVEVKLDRREVFGGESLQAAVRIRGGGKDMPIQEGRLRLICENEYEWRETTSTSTGSSTTSTSTTTTTHTATEQQVVEEQRFLAAGVLGAGAVGEYALVVRVPPAAVPTADGKITRVRWKVEATLARPRARDVSTAVPVRVLTVAEESWSQPADTVESHGDCELALRVSRAAYRAGESIEGALVVNPIADCDVNEIRVELERAEHVSRGDGNDERVREAVAVLADASALFAGQARELAFRLDVPPNAVPSLRTPQTLVRWRLKGIGSRRLRRDYRVERELLIANTPASRSEADRGVQYV